MTIPYNIIKEFAQVVNQKNESTNKFYYGVIVTSEDEKFVKLDGSDELTPITIATDAMENDRVIVKMEDHEVAVIGNLTAPASARTATNYMRFTEDETGDGGLKIGKYKESGSDEIAGSYTVMKNDGYYIYEEDGTPVAWFAKDVIRLGGEEQSKIELLGEANNISGVTRTITKPDGSEYTSSGIYMTGINYASIEQAGFHENHPTDARVAVSSNNPGNGIGAEMSVSCKDIAIRSDIYMYPGSFNLNVHDTNMSKSDFHFDVLGGTAQVQAGDINAYVGGAVNIEADSMLLNQERILTETDRPSIRNHVEATGSVPNSTNHAITITSVTIPAKHSYLLVARANWDNDSDHPSGARCLYFSSQRVDQLTDSNTGISTGMYADERPGGNSGGAPQSNILVIPIEASNSDRTRYLNCRYSGGAGTSRTVHVYAEMIQLT